MLKQRVITAAILIPLFIFLIFGVSPRIFSVVTAIIMLIGAWEWTLLMGVTRFPQCFFYPVVMFFVLILMFALIYLHKLFIPYILYIALVWWLLATLLVVCYPKASVLWGKSILVRAIMGFLVLIPCWLAINFIRVAYGPYLLLFLFILIWGADIGAYFAGKKWGKNKLAPEVSPGKTWQGLYGAIVVTLLVALLGSWWFAIPAQEWWAVIALSLITVLFSVVGDLFESMLKRNVGVKDSGQIFPGHGGLLDRIDSLTAAAPVFALGSLLLGKIFH